MYAKYTADGKSGLFRVLHPNIAVLPHFVYAVGSYTSTQFFEGGTGGAAATTVASAKHQTRVRSCGCAVIFLHQRNEWHNEATSTYVRAPSVALPVGLCRRQMGETREEGGHILSRDYALNK